MTRRRFLLLVGALTLAALMVSGVALAQGVGPLSPRAALSTGFIYQGRLIQNGDTVTGTCDFRFTLYDAADGDPVGTPQDKPDERVSDGYFTVENLDFGASAFAGDRRWLGVEVDCEGDGTYADLGRQELTAAPYALYAASTGALQGHPVSTADPTSGQALTWDGTQWAPAVADGGGDYWSLTGNGGTTPSAHFLGTTDNVSLTLAVNGSPALRIEPHATSPNLIGGYVSNTVSAGVYGATIGGGGNSSEPNRVTDDYGTIGGGWSNQVGNAATVGGGVGNWAINDYTTIGGGAANAATALYATVGGGEHNQASGDYAAVGGGLYNDASGNYGTVPGGYYNDAAGDYSFAAGQWARALHDGAFVWADAAGPSFDSTADNQFLVRATGGVSFITDGAPFHINGKPVYQPSNMIIVAKSGGDYTSVQTAIDSIGDAAVGNPYLVWVAPGVYSETVTMKPYVHLQGAGQEATVISSTVNTGSFPPDQATLTLARDISLRDMTVVNRGAVFRSVALLATDGMTQTLVADVVARAQGVGGASEFAIFLSGSGTGVTLRHVTGLAENGSDFNYGLYNHDGAETTLRGGSFTARGGISIGIQNSGAGTTLEAEGVTALAEDGTNNYGLQNESNAAATLRGGSFTGRGGSYVRGIYNSGSDATLEAEGIAALAENGSNYNRGLDNYYGAAATLRGGSFIGRGGSYARGIHNPGSGTTLEAENVNALGENGSSNNYGLHSSGGATAALRGGSLIGRGGTGAGGIQNEDNDTTLEVEGVAALGEDGGASSHGLYNDSNVTVILRGGSFTGRGGTGSTYGIYNDGVNATLEIEEVTILGEDNSSYNYGLYNFNGTVRLHGGSLTGRGGNYTRGLANYGNGASLEVEDATTLAENGSINNYGLDNSSGAGATLRGGSFTGQDNVTRGIYNHGSGSVLDAERITAVGQDGSTDCGFYNASSAVATADSSQLIGDSYGLYQSGGTVRLGVSQLYNGAHRTSGTLTCFQVYDESYSAYTCP